MRFTERNNRLLNLGLLICLFGSCLVSVACQTKQQKVDSALKQCQQLLDKDDLDAATKCYGAAVLANPESGSEISKAGKTAVFKKCLDYKHGKEFEKSIICLEGMITLEPDSANVNSQLADTYYKYYLQNYRTSGYKDSETLIRAERYIKKSIEITPQAAIYHEIYGGILKEKNDLKSLEEYKQALKINPREEETWVFFAIAQERFGDEIGAIESYKQALNLIPDDTLALFNLAKLYEKFNKTDEAIAAYEKLLQIKAPYDNAEQRLNELKKKRENEEQRNPKQKAKAA